MAVQINLIRGMNLPKPQPAKARPFQIPKEADRLISDLFMLAKLQAPNERVTARLRSRFFDVFLDERDTVEQWLKNKPVDERLKIARGIASGIADTGDSRALAILAAYSKGFLGDSAMTALFGMHRKGALGTRQYEEHLELIITEAPPDRTLAAAIARAKLASKRNERDALPFMALMLDGPRIDASGTAWDGELRVFGKLMELAGQIDRQTAEKIVQNAQSLPFWRRHLAEEKLREGSKDAANFKPDDQLLKYFTSFLGPEDKV